MQEIKEILEKIERPRNKDELVPAWWIKKNILSFVDQALAKLKEVPEQGWIPVSERLPEVPVDPPNSSSETVWLIFEGTPQMGYYTNFDGWRVFGIRFQKRLNQKDITHWMPIILPSRENKKLVEGQKAKIESGG